MEEYKNLRNQITEAAGNVVYTYAAHWNIVNRLRARENFIKWLQIILTGLSTSGFLYTFGFNKSCWSWVPSLASAIALGLNLYVLHFNISEEIQKHRDAANALWDVREAYKALIVDFEALEVEEIRSKRNELTRAVSRINKIYPGTDEESFQKAQREIGNYIFKEGEAELFCGKISKSDVKKMKTNKTDRC